MTHRFRVEPPFVCNGLSLFSNLTRYPLRWSVTGLNDEVNTLETFYTTIDRTVTNRLFLFVFHQSSKLKCIYIIYLNSKMYSFNYSFFINVKYNHFITIKIFVCPCSNKKINV